MKNADDSKMAIAGSDWESRSNDNPLVSVIILNYKRRDALAQTLDCVIRQEYNNVEIIVADNHSEEDIRSFVEERGPNIQLIELSQNLGTCGGRNAGIRKATGEIIITIDNDVQFASCFEISKVVNAFRERPSAHILVFQICDADSGELRLREWCHPRNWEEFSNTEFETYYLPEGACAFRREVFENVGLYFEPFFIGGEGGDLAFRAIDRGLRILYCPRIKVFHLMSPETRGPDRFFYFYTRNWIWIAYKDFHFYAGMRYLIPKMLSMIFFTCRSRSFRYFGRGLWDGLRELRSLRSQRTPMNKETVQYLDRLEEGRPSWKARFERHRLQSQI